MKKVNILENEKFEIKNYNIICAISMNYNKDENQFDQYRLYDAPCNLVEIDETLKEYVSGYILIHTYQNGWDSWGNEYVCTVNDIKNIIKNAKNKEHLFIKVLEEYFGK
ncbi:hypothetical protein [Clostridioides difficile]|uniref:hypothetical protein n=1 Tax=Clostridioides difficile TaxID=1496 RepID=UPI0020C4085E|nr:hypothetical protein [Clostridioides difficile]MCP8386795.1 hypothetical protein [Clostridioides difficile]